MSEEGVDGHRAMERAVPGAGDEGVGNSVGGSEKMASLPVPIALPGHEGFVQPSSYLRRPRGHSSLMTPANTQPETAVDRDQRIGLVCQALTILTITFPPIGHQTAQ